MSQQFSFNIGITTAGLAIDPQTFGRTALGGSESALIYMARALGTLGQKVTVFCVLDGPSGQVDPTTTHVRYFDIREFDQRIQLMNFDLMIVSRHIGFALKPIKAGAIWYWAHDIAPQHGFDESSFLVDRMLFLSDYHRSLYQATLHKGFYPLMHVTRNGIDENAIRFALERKKTSPQYERQADHFCYTSRPERGAMFLLGSLWPRIRQQLPDAQLHLAWYDLKNMEIGSAVQQDIDFVMHLVKESAHLGVTYHGALSKEDLYLIMARCNALLYPSTFPESSCISALEGMALGTFPITTNKYALPETLGDYGWLIDGTPGTPDYDDAFIDAAIAVYDTFDNIKSQNWRFEMSSYARLHYDWLVIASEWLRDMTDFFEQRFMDHEERIYDNLLYHSDVTTVNKFTTDRILHHASNTASERLYAEKSHTILDVCQTEKEAYMRGASHLHWRENYRFLKAIEVMKPVLDTAMMVCDVGCGTGDFLACLHVQYPDLILVGLDFSEDCVAEARAFIQQEGLDASKFTFHVRTVEEPWTTECFDAVFCGEVLEHVEDTQAMLTKLEGLVKPGGAVCITTPAGPWSQIAFRKEGPGIERHIHHFRMTDLQDILGGRGTIITIDYIDAGTTERGEPIGNFVTCWTVVNDRRPFGCVDVQKKVLTTRPYQKLSACIISRNEEDKILRCLKSLDRVVDEILIGDVESTDMTVQMVKIFTGAHYTPLFIKTLTYDIDGDGLGNFSPWKNEVLNHATGDWTLCIDCDEILKDGKLLRRYLDTPSLNAYAMQQVNVSIGLPETINTPQRLIRNHMGYEYKGCIHEHVHTADPGYQFIEPFLIMTDVTLPHDGYLLDHDRYYKAAIRNLPMIKKDRRVNPDRIYGKVMEMRDVLNIARWARNKHGMLRPEDIEALRQLILVYEEHFSTPGNFFYADANRYYQDALILLAILNVVPYGQRHIPLHAQLQAAVSMGPLTQQVLDRTPPLQRWFKNVDELEAYLITQVDILRKGLGPLGEPSPDHKPSSAVQSLLDSVSVP